MIEWFRVHDTVIFWVTGASMITFISTLIFVPWLIIRIPSDYFLYRRRVRKIQTHRRPAARIALLSLKNILGYILIVTGIIMLAIPGQGLLTILTGIILIDLPGKYRVERWIVARRPVLKSINWLRKRARRGPLIIKGRRDINIYKKSSY